MSAYSTFTRQVSYVISLVSNIAASARQDAQAIEEANRRMTEAVGKTDKAMSKTDKAAEGLSQTVGQEIPASAGAAEKALDKATRNALVPAEKAITKADKAAEGLGQTMGKELPAQAAAADRALDKTTRTAIVPAERAIERADRAAEGLGRTLGHDVQAGAATAERALARVDQRAREAERAMRALGSHTVTDRQMRYVDRLAQGYDRAQAGMGRIPELMTAGGVAYMSGRTVMAPPLRAYSDLESSSTDLKVAMMGADGRVSTTYGAIVQEAVSLGGKLPGTTADFMRAARALSEQGTPPEVIAGGGLRASAYFGALFGLDQYSAAETVAKLREAHGLKDNELVPMADLMQRGRFGFGINPQDYRMVAAYAAPTYNSMGLGGLDNAKRLLAIQGMAAGVGLEASSFGTNFAQMLERLGTIDSRVAKKSPEAKAVAEALGKHGIQMSFFDNKGSFKGIDNMLLELAKMRSMSALDQQHALKLMFGVEGGRPAQILVQKGYEEYQKALKKIEDQADIEARINEKMTTFAAKLEALGGTITNTMAVIARGTGEALKPAMDSSNDAIGQAGDWFDENPRAGTAGLIGATAGAGYLGVRGVQSLYGMVRPGSRAAASAAGAGLVTSSWLAHAGPAVKMSAASRGFWRVAPWIGTGLEAYEVMSDDTLTDSGRDRKMAGVLAGGGGAMLGAKLGAAAGTFVLPGVGTLVGGALGGLGGYFGGKLGMDYLWQPNADIDYKSGQAGTVGGPRIQVGQGTLDVKVTVQDDRVSVRTGVLQQPDLVRIQTSDTNPGSYPMWGMP